MVHNVESPGDKIVFNDWYIFESLIVVLLGSFPKTILYDCQVEQRNQVKDEAEGKSIHQYTAPPTLLPRCQQHQRILPCTQNARYESDTRN